MRCAAGTNGCLDFRRPAFALDWRVSAEWSRCPGSMAQRARDAVAPMRRSSADWIPARIGRLSAGHPVTIRKASLTAGSMRRVWALRHQTCAQYSAVEWNKAGVAIRRVVALVPQPEPGSRLRSATRDVSFLQSDSRCRQYVSDLTNVTPRCLGSEQKCRVSLLYLNLSSRLASFLLRWKAADTVFVVLSFSFQVWRYSPTVAMSLVSTSSTACQSPSAWMTARSWLLFGDGVWQVRDVDVEEKRRQDRSLWDAVLGASQPASFVVSVVEDEAAIANHLRDHVNRVSIKHQLQQLAGEANGARRKFPREGLSFVTIVWRHKSTLGEVPKARPFLGVRGHVPGKILQNYTQKYAFLCILESSFSIMLLRDLLVGETEKWTFVWGSWNKPVCVLGCYVLDMHRLSKTLIEVCGLKSHASRSVFLVFIVTCVKLLNSHVWSNFVSERMKLWNENQAEEAYCSHKNLRSAYISDQKTKSVYFKLRPLPSLSYVTAEYNFFFRVLGGPWHSSPLRTLVGEAVVPWSVEGCCVVDKHSSGLLFSWKAILDVLCQQGDLVYGWPPVSKARRLVYGWLVYGCLLVWSTGLLVYGSTGLLIYWSTGLLVYWSTGLLVYWSTGPVFGWPPVSKALLPREQWVDDWVNTGVDESLEDFQGDTQQGYGTITLFVPQWLFWLRDRNY